LEILREKCCAVPFILFAGRGREELMGSAGVHGIVFISGKAGIPGRGSPNVNIKSVKPAGDTPQGARQRRNGCPATPFSRVCTFFSGLLWQGPEHQACGVVFPLLTVPKKRSRAETVQNRIKRCRRCPAKADTVTAPRYAYISRIFYAGNPAVPIAGSR